MDLLSANVKQALFVVIALHLPTDEDASQNDDSQKTNADVANITRHHSWSKSFLIQLTIHLDISDSYVDCYLPLIISLQESQSNGNRDLILASSTEVVDTEVHRNVYLLMEIISFLLINQMYDGRGRSLVCNLLTMKTIIISGTCPLISVEYSLIQTIQDLKDKNANSLTAASSSKSQKYDNQNNVSCASNRSQLIRYAQIGVVTLGAGALLALTGGLAAPAVAAAVVGMGGSTALAAVFSFTFMASLFGTAGASLAAYRMDKRTKGLNEFVFEKQEANINSSPSPNNSSTIPKTKADLSVVIAISGWMTQSDEDYRRTFGVVPTQASNISLYERLYRFYKVNDPNHLVHVKEEAMLYTDASGSSRTMEPNRLYRKLRKKYPDVDPLKREHLMMPAYTPRLLNQSCRMYLTLIVERILLQQQLMQYKERMMEFTDSVEQEQEFRRIKDQILAFDTTHDLLIKCGYRKNKQHPYQQQQDAQPLSESMLDFQSPPNKPLHRPTSKVETDLLQPNNVNDNKPSSALTVTHVVNPPSVSSFSSSSSSEPPSKPSHSTAVVELTNHHTTAITTTTTTINTTITNSTTTLSTALVESSPVSLYWDWNDLSLSCTHEYYLLRWETKLQLELGTLVEAYMKSIRDAVVQNIVENLFFYSLASAVALPAALLKVTEMVDGGVWNIAIHRADLAGRELARAILAQHTPSNTTNVVSSDVNTSASASGGSGSDTRPLTLIGFSIGARVIFSCLKELTIIRFRQIRSKQKKKIRGNGIARDATRRVSAVMSAVGRMKKMSAKTNPTSSKTEACNRPAYHSIDISNVPTLVGADENNSHTNEKNDTDDTEGFYDSDIDDDDLTTAIIDSNDDDATTSHNNDENNEDDDENDIDTATAEDEASINRFIDSKIHNVILLGTPVAATNRHWKSVRRIVSGRLINGYCTSDMMLGIIYRAQRVQVNVAGLTEVHIPYTAPTSISSSISATMTGAASSMAGAATSVVSAVKGSNQNVSHKANTHTNDAILSGNTDSASTSSVAPLVRSAVVTSTRYYGDVENIDLTDIVKQHTDYSTRMKDILDRMDLK